MAGIRAEHWIRRYESVKLATTRPFEIIIISPYPLPPPLQDLKEIKYVKDYGSPVRCVNIGVSVAEGKYFVPCADDAVSAPGSLDLLVDNFNAMPPNEKNVVTAKYTEAGNYQADSYYLINNSTWTSSPHVPNDWYIFNEMIMNTSYFIEMGGWDTAFEGPALASTDFAIRCYRDGAVVKFLSAELSHFDHEGNVGGTHAPIYNAFVEWDSVLYKKIHDSPDSLSRTRIDFNGWKKAPTVWERRFGAS